MGRTRSVFQQERTMIDLAGRFRKAQEAVLPQLLRITTVPVAARSSAARPRAAMARREPALRPPGEDLSLRSRVAAAFAAAQRYVLARQADDGHWCGELEGDTIVESEYLLTLRFLGREGGARAKKLAAYVRSPHLPRRRRAAYQAP